MHGFFSIEYKIVERESFKVFGKSIETSQVDGQCFKDIKNFLNKCHENGVHEKIRLTAGYGVRKDPQTKQVFQVLNVFKANGTFTYMIAAEYPLNGSMPNDLEILGIPKLTYGYQ
jgi:AraC family transcriptional regulator